MSVFKKIRDVIKEAALMNELCEHFQRIGINARLLESGSSETIGPRRKRGIFASGYVLGCVRVEGRNLDLVQVERQPSQTIPPLYGYTYVVRAIAPDFMRRQVKRTTLGPLAKRKA